MPNDFEQCTFAAPAGAGLRAAVALASTHPSDALRAAYAKVDGYQPVYKYEGEFQDRPVSRACVDRVEFFVREFGDDIRNLSILDVGCSMGYISLALAERGAEVTGLDFRQDNINFCNALKREASIKASFACGAFTEQFCQDIPDGRYDVAFFFSVLHHVTLEHGVDAVRRMMQAALDKCDVVYAELALQSENVSFQWKDALPADELAIFKGIPDIEITRIGEFPALGSTVVRPLYRVRKTAKAYSGVRHAPLAISRSGIKTGETRDRKYAQTDALFTKIYKVQNEQSYFRFTSELDAYRRIGRHPNFSPVLGSEVRGALATITWPRVSGKTVMDALKAGDKLDAAGIARDVVSILKAFDRAGLYWNDFRTHNLIISESGLVAHDLEVASPYQVEHALDLFLWFLYDLQSGSIQSHRHNIFAKGGMMVGRPPIGPEEYLLPQLALPALASRNLRDFLSKI